MIALSSGQSHPCRARCSCSPDTPNSRASRVRDLCRAGRRPSAARRDPRSRGRQTDPLRDVSLADQARHPVLLAGSTRSRRRSRPRPILPGASRGRPATGAKTRRSGRRAPIAAPAFDADGRRVAAPPLAAASAVEVRATLRVTSGRLRRRARTREPFSSVELAVQAIEEPAGIVVVRSDLLRPLELSRVGWSAMSHQPARVELDPDDAKGRTETVDVPKHQTPAARSPPHPSILRAIRDRGSEGRFPAPRNATERSRPHVEDLATRGGGRGRSTASSRCRQCPYPPPRRDRRPRVGRALRR